VQKLPPGKSSGERIGQGPGPGANRLGTLPHNPTF